MKPLEGATEADWFEAARRAACPELPAPEREAAGAWCSAYDERYNPGRGPWMPLSPTRRFWPLSPRPEDVHIEDVARSLSRIPRFLGHTRVPYSVAQHCVLVSRLCPHCPLLGLLHDAPEAFAGDLITPVKRVVDLLYGPLETRLMEAVCVRYGLVSGEHAWGPDREVKRADKAMLAREMLELCGFDYVPGLPEPAPPIGQVWGATYARGEFLARFREVGGTE